MIEYARGFMLSLGFDEAAVECLCGDLSHILACEQAKDALSRSISAYEADIQTDFSVLLKQAAEAGACVGVHEYRAHMLLCVLLSKHLHVCYQKEGISDEIFWTSMSDLKWKLWECKMLRGVYGTCVGMWHGLFFGMNMFAMGRLQYEIRRFRRTYEKNGKRLRPDSLVLGVHIPRTMTPFSKESCDESFARAKEFFRGRLGDAPMAFVCNSWLLYPENEKILHEKSNIRKFMARFDITERTDVDNYDEMSSVFDMEYTGNLEDYPENSFLQKAYKDYLKQGGMPGRGFGVFFAE